MSREKLNLFFEQVSLFSLYILIFFIPISTATVESFAGVSLLFFLARLFVCKGLFSKLFKKEKIILLFFVSLAISVANSGVFMPLSLTKLFAKWLQYITLYLIISYTFIDTRRIKYALAVISFVAALVILDCYSQLFFNFEFLRHRNMIQHSNNIFALSGPFKHNNALAGYLICALIIILYWVFLGRNRLVRITAIVFFLLGISLLPLTYSRGAYISFIVGIILLLLLLRKRLILCAVLIFSIILGLKFVFLKSLLFKDAGRFESWSISLRMIKEHPLLGNGIGTFMALFKSYSPSGNMQYAHNCFLQLWAEAGLIALVIFILFILKTLKKGFLSYKTTKNYIFLILACAIITYLSHSFFDNNLFSLQLAVLFWVLMGLLKGSILSIGC